MARYTASVVTSKSPEEAFAYMADFANTREWDPGVVDAERLDAGELHVGSQFRVDVKVGSGTSRFVYGVTLLDSPRTVVLLGENQFLVSEDRIDVAARDGGGATITYDAKLTFKGPLRLFDPLLGLTFRSVGDRALGGLRRVLGSDA
jgi:hypothetical protein